MTKEKEIKKLKQDVHDLLHMLTRGREWVDITETTYTRHFRNARAWFDGLETRLKEIAKDV